MSDECRDVKHVSDQHSRPDQYVKLNVGGRSQVFFHPLIFCLSGSLFQTTIGTLIKYDSMLKTMFSGRMEVR